MRDERFMAAARAALDALAARHDIEYADVRVAEHVRERMVVRAGQPDDGGEPGLRGEHAPGLHGERATGLCVRVLCRGAWGVATASEAGEDAAQRAANLARERAGDAAAVATERVRLAEEEPQVGSHATALAIDPFALPAEQRAYHAQRAIAALEHDSSHRVRIVRAGATLAWERIDSVFCSTAGTCIEQRLVTSGAGLEIVATGPGGPVTRSWPARGELALCRAGHEFVDELDLKARALRLGRQALALAVAPPCPADITTLIVDSDQLAVQIRDTCALPSLRAENRAGLAPLDRLGRARLGSTLVNLVADGRVARGAATAGWDDEGVPARLTPLVSRGVIVGLQTSRATAERSGLGRSSGSMRAPWCDQPPGLATSNVILLPDERGPGSLDELVADTDRGVLMVTSAGVALAGARHEFACEAAWQIERGKRVRLVRAPRYAATAAGLWRHCDAMGGRHAFALLGLRAGAAGLGASVGCAPARFRGIEVGSRS